jgi:hypothetical protein
MNLKLLLACCAALSPLAAESLRVVDVRELVGAGAGQVLQEEIRLWGDDLESVLIFPSVTIAGEGSTYLAPPAGKGEVDDFSPEQGSLLVAFRLPDDQPVEGVVHLRAEGAMRLTAFPFKFDPARSEPATEDAFQAVRQAHYVRLARVSLPGAAWFRHRAGDGLSAGQRRARPAEESLDATFQLVSGSRAVAENLALDRELLLGEGVEGEAVAVDSLKGVTVRAIDWTGKLEPGEVATDPLARLIPHDQHALFVPTMAALYQLIDVIEEEGAPVLQSFDARSPYRKLAARYQAQMGLDVPEMIATRLPVDGVAVTGGDPFYPSGTDLALVFATGNPDVLFDTLATMIAVKAKLRGATAVEALPHRGFQTPDRSFSAYLAKFDGAVVVANSPVPLERIAAVAAGGAPALGALDEFKFFRQRYPLGEAETAYLFLSDATIRRWSGPGLRIAASRRTRAAAALGGLTARQLDGQPPGDDFAGLLGATDSSGPAPRSEIYNTLGFLTPVSELALQSATPAEAAAYERWRGGYESGWAQAFDPIAIRLRLDKGSREIDLSVLPLTVDSDYREWMDITGTTPPERGALAAHPEARLFFSFAVDPESKHFRDLGEWSFSMIPALKARPLAWVGESVSVFLDDGFFLKAMAAGDAGEVLRSNYLRLPLGVRIASRSSARLAIFLAALRGFIDESAPDLLKWERRKHANQSYLAVLSGGEDDPSMQGGIYYAALKDSLLLALDEKVLLRAIDRAGNVGTTGKHIHAEADPSVLAVLGGTLGSSLEDRQRRESWSALPILNEWRQLMPDKDPLAVHAAHFLENIHCPGGQGYRWNEAAGTMESVAFGHPADPRGEEAALKLVRAFSRVRAGIEFEDDGLRLRLSMDQGAAKPEAPAAAADPGIPAGFPRLEDLIQPKPGTKWKYRVTETYAEGPFTKDVETLAVTPVESGTVIRNRVSARPPGEEEMQIHEEEHLLDGGGYHMQGSKQGDSAKTFSRRMPVLPGKLAPGLAFGGEHRSERKDEEGISQELGDVRATIIGLETVKVPAGVFENCVRIDGEYDYFTYGIVGRATDSTWYAPGVGLVKMTWKDEFDSGSEELEKFELPAAP